eukprot:scaffold1874_cov89-Skeletonema_dohrnii-CCMP3373.AAC.15
MSEDSSADTSCCASCGIAVDEVKLKECADCDLVKYCSDECQKNHIPQHKEDCKKRAAELRDEILFKQPESSHRGDCPICCLPLQLDKEKSTMNSCCSKVICNGCNYANQVREAERRLKKSCPFCREPYPSKNEVDKYRRKRIEANDPVAMCGEGLKQYNKGDYSSAFEYFTNAAELGDVEAHYGLAGMYRNGCGVEKNEKKEIHHFEEAAIGGHPNARYNLAFHEERTGDLKRAARHLIIAATQGSDESTKFLMHGFKKGFVSKDDLAAALRAHQAAVEETKSPQREAAEEFYRTRTTS